MVVELGMIDPTLVDPSWLFGGGRAHDGYLKVVTCAGQLELVDLGLVGLGTSVWVGRSGRSSDLGWSTRDSCQVVRPVYLGSFHGYLRIVGPVIFCWGWFVELRVVELRLFNLNTRWSSL